MIRIIIYVAALLSLGTSLVGQSFQSWSIAEVGYDLGRFDLEADYQLRHSYGPMALERRFAQVSVSYKILKDLKIGSAYRFGSDLRRQEFVPINRIAFLMQYRYKVNRLTFRPRIQWQYQVRTVNEEDRITQKFRLRMQGEYNIKKWKLDPKFAIEYFFSNEERSAYTSEKLRMTIGTEREIIDQLLLKVSYRYELGIEEDSSNLNILQIALSYSF